MEGVDDAPGSEAAAEELEVARDDFVARLR